MDINFPSDEAMDRFWEITDGTSPYSVELALLAAYDIDEQRIREDERTKLINAVRLAKQTDKAIRDDQTHKIAEALRKREVATPNGRHMHNMAADYIEREFG